jgi:NADP-dependent 3-hydroxy acid dehydrogenase YdfG
MLGCQLDASVFAHALSALNRGVRDQPDGYNRLRWRSADGGRMVSEHRALLVDPEPELLEPRSDDDVRLALAPERQRTPLGGVPCLTRSGDTASDQPAKPRTRRNTMTTDQSSGRVAVITGASSGIGEATARALAAEGYRLALLARRADRIQALAAELLDGAIAVEADVTDRDSIVAAAERVEHELGGADILVNNAGVMLLAPFTSEQQVEQRQMVEVNLLGAITATEVFLDQLRDGGGDLVNISSVAGRTARAGNAVYAATKWGLNGWSEALRQELQPDIRVTVIEPGAVATELTDHITHAETKRATQQFVKDLAITPQDIAEVIAFAVTRPRRMTLNEILVRPTAQVG